MSQEGVHNLSKLIDNSYQQQYWHCSVRVTGSKNISVVNDLPLTELQRQIVEPWLQSRPFTISGKIVRSSDQVEEIKIAYTPESQQFYADRHNAEMRAKGIGDMATNRELLPLSKGKDYTYEMLFSTKTEPAIDADVALIEQLCKRIGKSARILSNRQRKDKSSYSIEDEYDVQDLLHAILRAFLKYSVQEDPLQKVAGTRSSRADISIEELGIIIELKFVRSPDDQKKIFDEFSKDLVLYSAWQPLKTLFFVIYNSSDLRDPELLEKLSGTKEISEKRFNTVIILA
jgi:REase_DpnII-MboI